MDTPVGKIRAIHTTSDGLRLTVSVDAVVACPRCAAGKGCGAGLLSGPGRMRVIEAQAPEHLSLAVGDTVRLRMAASDLLLAALIVYGLPLLGLLAGAALAYGLGLGDAAAAGVALGGAGLGLILGRRRLGRGNCLQNFVPQVEARL